MNYKETTLSGISWTRCRAVTIVNPLAGTGEIDRKTNIQDGPVAYFQEETVLSVDGKEIRADAGSCSQKFDPTAMIQLRDPVSGELTGATMTHAELYTILYSLYLQTATERDAQ